MGNILQKMGYARIHTLMGRGVCVEREYLPSKEKGRVTANISTNDELPDPIHILGLDTAENARV